MITVLDDARPTARKAHVCDACGRTVAVGEQYRRQRCIGDHGPYAWKSCQHCDALADWIWRTDRDAFDPDYGLDIELWVGEYGSASLRDAFNSRWRGMTPGDVESLAQNTEITS